MTSQYRKITELTIKARGGDNEAAKELIRELANTPDNWPQTEIELMRASIKKVLGLLKSSTSTSLYISESIQELSKYD